MKSENEALAPMSKCAVTNAAESSVTVPTRAAAALAGREIVMMVKHGADTAAGQLNAIRVETRAAVVAAARVQIGIGAESKARVGATAEAAGRWGGN